MLGPRTLMFSRSEPVPAKFNSISGASRKNSPGVFWVPVQGWKARQNTKTLLVQATHTLEHGRIGDPLLRASGASRLCR